jgi:hypothetical protein
MIRMINPAFVILAATALWHALSAYKTGTYIPPRDFSPTSPAACMYHFNCTSESNTRLAVAFKRLEDDFLSSSAEVQAKKISNIQVAIRTKWKECGRGDDIPIIGWNDQADHDEDFLTWIPEDLAATDEEFARIHERTVLAEHLLFQQSETTPNTSFADVNASDTDTVVNDENTPPDDQATLPEDNIDPSLADDQV